MSILRKRKGEQNSAGELHRPPSVAQSNLTFSSLDEIGKQVRAAVEGAKSEPWEVCRWAVSLVGELQVTIMYYQVRENHVV